VLFFYLEFEHIHLKKKVQKIRNYECGWQIPLLHSVKTIVTDSANNNKVWNETMQLELTRSLKEVLV
jgi:hypothetical protein